MNESILLHPRTRAQADQYLAAPCHATLLTGPHGIGKTYLARTMLAAALGLSVQSLADYPYYLQVAPDGTSISIEAIRELQRFMQLKTVGHGQQFRRGIIIEHAEALTTEAQNAFLKLLEEPPADTLIILTANSQHALLPTILSRLQTLTVCAPLEATVTAFFAATAKQSAVTQAYFLSGGLPGLMAAILAKDQTHPLVAGVGQAKTILQTSSFERLALVEPLSKKKDEARYVLEALARIATTGVDQATAKQDSAKLKQWHRVLKQTHQAQEALQRSANPKLVLTNLMLHI